MRSDRKPSSKVKTPSGRPLDCAEFESSCWVVIRRDGATVSDARPTSVEKLARIDAATFLELMSEVPHDVAAIFSGSFTLRSDSRLLLDLEKMTGEALLGQLQARKASDRLPLVPTHEAAGELFLGLLESVEGAELYRAVTLYLVWGRAQPGLSVYLTSKEERQAVGKAEESAEANAPANDVEELDGEEPGSLFASKNACLAEMAEKEE